METNTVGTLYLPLGEQWERLEIKAFWPQVSRLATSKQVAESRDPATVFVPLEQNAVLLGRDVPAGCYLVRGQCSAVPGGSCTLEELLQTYEAQMVIQARFYDFGTMPHWELEVVR